MLIQESLFETPESSARTAALNARSGSFVDNMKLPIHRWFRYSAGFSAQWAEQVISETRAANVLDPFAGSGTTLLAADKLAVPSVGIEAHPFIIRVGEAKTKWDIDVSSLKAGCEQVLERAKSLVTQTNNVDTPALLQKCYEMEALSELYALRAAIVDGNAGFGEAERSYFFLALTAILRECSFVGTAQWQYVLPNKRKAKVTTPYAAFEAKVSQFIEDIRAFRAQGAKALSQLIQGDARKIDECTERKFDLLLTSPPYPNNYDYADATRLEMTFWGEVESWGGLHEAVRQFLVRSSSQHTAKERLQLSQLLESPHVASIRDELATVCRELERVRETKGGKKTYHTMVAAYFEDMALVLSSARRVMSDGGRMCFVIGDSAPYGVYVPADKWFSSLADAFGFKGTQFEKIRDRNTKWKNRKHTVPLNEGRLWIEC